MIREEGVTLDPKPDVTFETCGVKTGTVAPGAEGRAGLWAATGEDGEVVVRGACVFDGYETRDHLDFDPNALSFCHAPAEPNAKPNAEPNAEPDVKPDVKRSSKTESGLPEGVSAEEHCWFRTGDRGRLDEESYLTLTGRFKEVINRGGEKISRLST